MGFFDLDDLWEPRRRTRRRRGQPSTAEAIVQAIGFVLLLAVIAAVVTLALAALLVCAIGWGIAKLARRHRAAGWWQNTARRIAWRGGERRSGPANL